MVPDGFLTMLGFSVEVEWSRWSDEHHSSNLICFLILLLLFPLPPLIGNETDEPISPTARLVGPSPHSQAVDNSASRWDRSFTLISNLVRGEGDDGGGEVIPA